MSSTRTKKRPFPEPDGFSLQPRAQPRPQSRRPAVPNFRSDFALSPVATSNLPHPVPPQQKSNQRRKPLQVVDLERCRGNDSPRSRSTQDAPVPNENIPAPVNTRILSPPPAPVPIPKARSSNSTKVLNPPRLFSPPPRPSTPPKNLAEPDLSKFSHGPLRPSKPVSRTRIALATDVWTDGGRADLLGLALEQHGVQHATPTEKAVRRGLEVSPRKAGGIGKEIRYASGGLAEQASQVIKKKTTALSLWRKSAPSSETANMFVQVEEVISVPKPPPQRGRTGMLLCLARCRAREEGSTFLILFSVPPHDAMNAGIADLRVGCSVALWEPLLEVSSGEYLCSRFVVVL